MNKKTNTSTLVLILAVLITSCTNRITPETNNKPSHTAAPISTPRGTGSPEADPLKVSFVSDHEGNQYQTKQIGAQTWVTENLRVSTHPDGTQLVYFSVDTISQSNGNPEFLYNYTAVKDTDPCQGISPGHWVLPTQADWQVLINFLGGTEVAGEKMKFPEMWDEDPTSVSEQIGFNAVPAGMVDFTQVFQWQNKSAVFMSSSASQRGVVYYFIEKNSSKINEGNFHPDDAVSIRCLPQEE